jgi:ABC-type multidrug transport system fused ATPase/permease subunit
VWQILSGWALTSASVFAAAWFTKSKHSGIYVVIGFLVMAFGAMILNDPNTDRKPPTTTVEGVLSLLFPSMNFVFIITHYCRYEILDLPINLFRAAPHSERLKFESTLPTIAMWMFLVLQAIIYPILAIFVERFLHGISFRRRTFLTDVQASQGEVLALQTSGLSKTYFLPWYKKISGCFKKSTDVVALQDIDLVSQKRQILCLLGVNGSGKTTILELIAGIKEPTAGLVTVHARASQLGQLHFK